MLDILGFYTTLSLLNANPRVIRACGFFYDSWQPMLYQLVADLEEFDAAAERHGVAAYRRREYRKALARLDDIFKLKPANLQTHPVLANERARAAAAHEERPADDGQ